MRKIDEPQNAENQRQADRAKRVIARRHESVKRSLTHRDRALDEEQCCSDQDYDNSELQCRTCKNFRQDGKRRGAGGPPLGAVYTSIHSLASTCFTNVDLPL